MEFMELSVLEALLPLLSWDASPFIQRVTDGKTTPPECVELSKIQHAASINIVYLTSGGSSQYIYKLQGSRNHIVMLCDQLADPEEYMKVVGMLTRTDIYIKDTEEASVDGSHPVVSVSGVQYVNLQCPQAERIRITNAEEVLVQCHVPGLWRSDCDWGFSEVQSLVLDNWINMDTRGVHDLTLCGVVQNAVIHAENSVVVMTDEASNVVIDAARLSFNLPGGDNVTANNIIGLNVTKLELSGGGTIHNLVLPKLKSFTSFGEVHFDRELVRNVREVALFDSFTSLNEPFPRMTTLDLTAEGEFPSIDTHFPSLMTLRVKMNGNCTTFPKINAQNLEVLSLQLDQSRPVGFNHISFKDTLQGYRRLSEVTIRDDPGRVPHILDCLRVVIPKLSILSLDGPAVDVLLSNQLTASFTNLTALELTGAHERGPLTLALDAPLLVVVAITYSNPEAVSLTVTNLPRLTNLLVNIPNLNLEKVPCLERLKMLMCDSLCADNLPHLNHLEYKLNSGETPCDVELIRNMPKNVSRKVTYQNVLD